MNFIKWGLLAIAFLGFMPVTQAQARCYDCSYSNPHIKYVPQVSYRPVTHTTSRITYKPVTQLVQVKKYVKRTVYQPVRVKTSVTHMVPMTTYRKAVSYRHHHHHHHHWH